eukprot:scaffold449_cov138-Cylindrotheca_fusiformis.AAC.17
MIHHQRNGRRSNCRIPVVVHPPYGRRRSVIQQKVRFRTTTDKDDNDVDQLQQPINIVPSFIPLLSM